MKFRILLLIVLLISGSLLFFKLISAESGASDSATPEQSMDGTGELIDDEEPECEPCYEEWYECRDTSASGCNGELWLVWEEPCCDGGGEDLVEDCSPWQMCDDGSASCNCEGVCLEKPKNSRYYNNPTYSDNPYGNVGNTNVKLPVKLDWDNVEGWDPEGIQDGPQSYRLKLDNGASSINKPLNISEYNILENNGSCFLQPVSTYSWNAQACCTANGDNCGPQNTWVFKTSNAPEPLNPYDPDWEGMNKIENLDEEASRKLQWCKIENSDIYEETLVEDKEVYRPLSYKLLIYYSEDDSCHEQLVFRDECYPKILVPKKFPIPGEKLPPDELIDDGSLFTKKTSYSWKVAACKDNFGGECSDYSQLWRFSTDDWSLEEGTLVSPPDNAEIPIELPVLLRWNIHDANSYNYILYGVDSDKSKIANITFDFPKLSLNTVYKWTVQPCWDYESEECEDIWEGPWYFKTTGEPPILIYPLENDIPIPTKFEWQEVGGAKSYVFKIQGNGLNEEIPIDKTTLSLNYPDLKQEVNYTWQVKTCAKAEGKVCWDYSDPQTFKTFKLDIPQISFPKNNESFFTYQKNHILDWEKTKGGGFYEYEVNFINVSTKETNQDCNTGNIIPKTITKDTYSTSLNLICLGDYQWKIRACMDENCQDAGDWSEKHNFSFVQKKEPKETKGLVPCGRTEDDPSTTGWNEREDCEIKHIFLLIRNIVDFVLWTIGPLTLGLLVLGTGIMFYLSMRFQDALFITRIKLIWKATGIGYGILLFSWIILNLFLGLIGFNVGIFGNWWQAGF